MEEELRKEIDLVLEYSKGYFLGRQCHPKKAQILKKLLNKEELTMEDKAWISSLSEVTVFEQAMLLILNHIVFVLNHSKEE